jgi:hypothetical protein
MHLVSISEQIWFISLLSSPPRRQGKRRARILHHGRWRAPAVTRPTMDCVQGKVWLPRALFPSLDARFGPSLVETRLLGLGFHHSPPLHPHPPSPPHPPPPPHPPSPLLIPVDSNTSTSSSPRQPPIASTSDRREPPTAQRGTDVIPPPPDLLQIR